MAYILSFISQKGGVGKSTLARLVARQYAAADYIVKIADLDTKQTTSTKWYTRRAQLAAGQGPEVPVQPFKELKHALAEGERCHLLILDPGNADERIREIANISDYAVIPTTSSTDDLDPTIELARALADAGIPRDRIGVALCRTTGSEAAARAARDLVERSGFHALPGELPTKPTYENAASEGRAANETPHGSLNQRAEQLAASIMDRLEAVAAPNDQQKGVA